MCTRFYVEPDNEETQDIIEETMNSRLRWAFLKAGNAISISGEIRPTNVVPVIATRKDGKKAAFPMRWGYQIPGRSLLVNARVETAAEKPSFRESWQIHRCIIPASWYYEWEHLIGNSGQKKTGDKFMIQPIGYTMTYLAGLYRMEEGLPVFTVLTREPSEELKQIHDRMPLIFPGDLVKEWIDPKIRPESLLPYALTEMAAVRMKDQLELT
ncbi:MAG: SOS response-associated peptidase [Firmicutes bacterium]|nr:SOS response-associated peptidase [Bacillota bacterium]